MSKIYNVRVSEQLHAKLRSIDPEAVRATLEAMPEAPKEDRSAKYTIRISQDLHKRLTDASADIVRQHLNQING